MSDKRSRYLSTWLKVANKFNLVLVWKGRLARSYGQSERKCSTYHRLSWKKGQASTGRLLVTSNEESKVPVLGLYFA